MSWRTPHMLCVLVLFAPLAWADRAVDLHGALAVLDGKVVDAQGEPLSLAGPSLFWGNRGWGDRAEYPPAAYYSAAAVDYVNREWNAPIIRVAMGSETPGGYMEDPDGRWERIETVVEAAIERGMYVIVDWHTHKAEPHTPVALEFFRRVASRWGDTPNLIYEIYNEPLPESRWSEDIKPYAETVIAAIRAIDADNLIIVGTRSWSQDVDEAADDPITTAINIAYALHFYAATHGDELREKAVYAMRKKLPLFVSEWGSVSATGDGSVDREATLKWMEFLAEHQLSHCNWSLHSKDEAASILTLDSHPDANWDESNLTEAGKLIRDIIIDWHVHDYRATSEGEL